jgi:hypothetical protein
MVRIVTRSVRRAENRKDGEVCYEGSTATGDDTCSSG